MKYDDLFEQRSRTGRKLRECLKARGWKKIDFAKMAKISRPTLDRLLNGEIDNKTTFGRHMEKVLAILKISADELLYFDSSVQSEATAFLVDSTKRFQVNETAKKQFALLRDIVGLCEIYY